MSIRSLARSLLNAHAYSHVAEKYPYKAVGDAIRAARLERGLSQVALAAAVGASRETVVNWERGQKRPERFYDQLNATLGVDAEYLRLVGEVAAAREKALQAEDELRRASERLAQHRAAQPSRGRRAGKR